MKGQLVCGGIVMLLALTGRVEAAPAIRIDPGRFGGNGMLLDGGVAGEQQFGYYVITNTGTTTLKVKEMQIVGPNAGNITYNDAQCGQGSKCRHKLDLPPGGQMFFALSCVAPAPGVFPARLEIESNAHHGETATLTCNGFHPPVIQVSPNGLDFGTAHGCWFGDICGPRCNTQPATQTLTITNAAPPPSEVDLSVVLPQAGPAWDFTIDADQPSPFALAAGQSVHVTFTFHPMSPNGVPAYDGLTFTPTYPTGLAPVDVPFRARRGWGQLVFDTPPLLGTVAVGQTLTTTITAHNAGASCLNILGVASEDDIALVGPGTGMVLQAGESHAWEVTCTAPGLLGGSGFLDFDIYNDDPEFVWERFSCLPVGGGLWTFPAEMNFDSYGVAVGTSVTAQIGVYNPGDQPTALTAITSTDAHYTAVLASGSLPVSLEPGASTTFDLTFTPTDTARVTAAILLDASVGSDYTLVVSGAGVLGAPGLRTPSVHALAVPGQADPQDDAGCSTGARGSLPVALALLALRRRRRR